MAARTSRLAELRGLIHAHGAFALRTALEAVGHNKLRAGLTSLGILFGVASVIAMLAIGRGAEQEILEQMALLGTNNVIVTPIIEQKEEQVKDAKQEPKKFTPGLSYADVEAIRTTVPEVDAASGEVILNTLITRNGRHRSGKLVGVDSAYFRMMNLRLARGARFSHDQVANGLQVAVIGSGVKARFFADEDPIGKAVKVGSNWLTVIGVLEDRGLAGPNAQKLGIRDESMDVYVPVRTMLVRYRNRALVTQQEIEAASKITVQSASDTPEEDDDTRAERRNMNQLDRIIVRVDEARFVAPVADVLKRKLERRHNGVIDFEVTVPELLLAQEQRTKTIFNVVLGAIASISLIVGGIGIMNIMLASILERIREIGVRRAMGATQKDILFQFLAEAVLISVAGGLAGILVGGGLSFGIEKVAGIKTIVSGISVFVAFGVSFTVGIVFGIVPAHRAAQQDPVVCLRYE
ncbi:MAG TPA: ABC transporter permease [Gemmatimonadaceae bacterium]|nr:ABC transporter permease [Gemmatimonadaceae bacterium]